MKNTMTNEQLQLLKEITNDQTIELLTENDINIIFNQATNEDFENGNVNVFKNLHDCVYWLHDYEIDFDIEYFDNEMLLDTFYNLDERLTMLENGKALFILE